MNKINKYERLLYTNETRPPVLQEDHVLVGNIKWSSNGGRLKSSLVLVE